MRTAFIVLIPLLAIAIFASAQERSTQIQRRGVSVEEAAGDGIREIIPAGSEIKGHKYAVLVGVAEYQNMKRLSFTKNDAEALRDQLLALGFAPGNIRTLTSGSVGVNEPTKQNIEKAVRDMLEKARDGDLVMISLSGHGTQPANLGPLFCPPEADRSNLSATTVPINKIRDDMGDCNASFKLLIVDACRDDNPFGMTINNTDVRTIPVSRSAGNAESIAFKGVSLEGFDTIAPLENLTVFQSCSDGQLSWEDGSLGGKGHGLFTYYIIEALKGGAADDKGNIGLLKLVGHATEETLRHSQNHAGMTEQRPKMSFNGNDFVLANVIDANRPDLVARPAFRRTTTLDLPQQPGELPPVPDGGRRINVATTKELLDAVNSRNLRDGDVIVLKPGVYTPDSLSIAGRHPLDHRTGVPIVLYGDPSDPEKVEIRIRNGRINITRDTPLYLTGLEVSSANGGGIQVDGEAEVGILFCRIRDCKGDGIYNRARIFVDSCVITGNGTGFQSAGKSDVNNCRIEYNKNIGVAVFRNAKGRFSDNILFDNSGGNWRVVGNVQN